MIRAFWLALFAFIAICAHFAAYADEISPCDATSMTFINHRAGAARVCVGAPAHLWSLTPGYFMRSFSETGCFVHPAPGSLVDVNDQIRVGHEYLVVFDSGQIGCRVRPSFVIYFPVIAR